MSVLVRGCGGPAGPAGVHTRGQVSKVPGHGYRSDGGGGRETNAAVNILHWKRPQRDGKVHLKHIVGQSPTTILHRADNGVSASYIRLRALNVGLIVIKEKTILIFYKLHIFCAISHHITPTMMGRFKYFQNY